MWVSVGKGSDDIRALSAFADALFSAPKLSNIDLLYNRIGESGANVLLPAVQDNPKIDEFLVDATLPIELFELLFRRSSGKKGKKGKGKKGKGGGKKKKK